MLNYDIDFCVDEQEQAIYTHNFKKSALQYEVVICLKIGDIVWIKRPNKCRICTGINFFKMPLSVTSGQKEGWILIVDILDSTLKVLAICSHRF